MKHAISDVLADLSKNRIVRCRPPANRKEIRDAETVLGVRFPKVYVDFLLLCGVLDIYDRGVFGLGPFTRSASRSTNSVVFQTQDHRDFSPLALPHHFVVLWDESHYDPDCLDTSRVTRDGDCPVISYHAPRSAQFRLAKPRKVASGLGEWLYQKLEQQTKYKAKCDADPDLSKRLTFLGGFRRRKRTTKKTRKKAPGTSKRPSRKT